MSVFTDAFVSIASVLGVDATYKAAPIRVLFKNGSIIAHGVETLAPMAECLDTDIAGVVHGDTLTIAGTAYKVIGIEPADLAEITTLILSKG
jgi:hypothetical protein